MPTTESFQLKCTHTVARTPHALVRPIFNEREPAKGNPLCEKFNGKFWMVKSKRGKKKLANKLDEIGFMKMLWKNFVILSDSFGSE